MPACLLLDGNKPASEDHLYELPAEVCKRWFNGHRFGRIGTIGDGSCFFHSVCLGLNIGSYRNGERQKIAWALRKVLSDSFQKKNFDEISATLVGKNSKSFEDIKKAMKNPKTWAEEIMIKWCSRFLKANIIFLNLSNNSNVPYCGVHDIMTLEEVKRCIRPELPTVIVAWVNSSHFELICRIDKVTSKDVSLRTAFDPNNVADLETIENLMKSYRSHCYT